MPLDDSYHFGNLVDSKLRLYNDDIRCAIQSDILKIFLRVGRGFYNRVADSPHTSHTNTPLSKSQYLIESDHSQQSQYSEQYQSHDDYNETSRSRPSTPSSQSAHQLPNHSQYQHPAKLLKQPAYPNQSDYSQQSQSLEQFQPHNDYHSEYHRTATLLSQSTYPNQSDKSQQSQFSDQLQCLNDYGETVQKDATSSFSGTSEPDAFSSSVSFITVHTNL